MYNTVPLNGSIRSQSSRTNIFICVSATVSSSAACVIPRMMVTPPHSGTHSYGRGKHVSQLGTTIDLKVLNLTDITHGRFRGPLAHRTITGKGRCALSDMLYHSGLGKHTVLLHKKIVLTHCQSTSADIFLSPQQLVHHHDGQALRYEFFNLIDGSRCSHTDR